MLTSKQLKIFNIFAKNIFKEYSFKDLKNISKEKSNSLIQNAIKQFIRESLVTRRRIGTSKLYRLNYKNEKIYTYLEIFVLDNLSELVKRSISIIKEELDKYTFFYSLIIFGSYVGNTNKEKSDLDIAVIIPNKKNEKNIKIAMNSASNKSLLDLDFHIIDVKDFLEMLEVDYVNLGKEIAMKNLPIYNSAIFYKLILRSMKHGF